MVGTKEMRAQISIAENLKENEEVLIEVNPVDCVSLKK